MKDWKIILKYFIDYDREDNPRIVGEMEFPHFDFVKGDRIVLESGQCFVWTREFDFVNNVCTIWAHDYRP